METTTSFIPKKVLTERPEMVRRWRPSDLILTISFIALGVSVVFYGGVYLYKYLLDQQINRPCEEIGQDGGSLRRCGLRVSVELEEKNLDRATILMLQRLDSKFKIAEEIARNHTDLVGLFYLLEETTLPTLAYTKLVYQGTTLQLDGKATAYEDIAVQGDIFMKDQKRIRSFTFSDLNLDDRGNVVFRLNLNIDPAVVAYQSNLPQ